MKKNEFLIRLKKLLHELPTQDIEKSVQYYSEMIDDRIEEGLSEDEAVSAIGTPDEIASNILLDEGLPFDESKSEPKRKMSAIWIVLLILGFPLWFSLIIAAFAVLFSLIVSLWAVIISLWSVFVSFIAVSFSGLTVGIGFSIIGNVFPGIAMISAGLILAGLSVFSFYGCRMATKGACFLTKKTAVFIKNCFIKRETV